MCRVQKLRCKYRRKAKIQVNPSLGILWLIVAALFVLWVIGLAVHWAAAGVWALFIIGIMLLVLALAMTLFRDAFRFVEGLFRPRRPMTR
jgi:hypothetical protein